MSYVADAESRYASPRGLLELWAGVVLAPLAWTLHLSVSYFMAGVLCDSSWNSLMLLGTVVFLMLALLGMWYAWANIRRTGREWPRGEVDGVLIRSRFLAVGGLLLSGLSVLLIIAQTIPILVLPPCRS